MILLLDSCTFIWLASEPARLSPKATAAVNDPASVLHISHASLWEISLKHAAGKLTLPDPPRQWWAHQVARWSLTEIPLTAHVLLRGSELPQHHKDPFDRVIIAEALEQSITLVSPDSNFPSYGAQIIW